jgi:hypothetical protein
MKMRLYAAVLLTAAACAGVAGAVPPAYTGQHGNAEEPALRPVKWTWAGVTSLVKSTKDGLASGVEKNPASMVGEGAVGAVKGTGSLASGVGHGIVGAPLPPKKDRKALSYEQAAMIMIDGETNKFAGDRPTQGPWPEYEKSPDPAEQFRKPAPSTVLPARDPATVKPLVIEESVVEKAQRNYVPVQASYRDNRRLVGTGNLLHLAK